MPLPLLAGALVAGKALGGFLKGRGEDKKAKAQAANQGAMNKWKHKFDTASFETEKRPYYGSRDKTRSLRANLFAGLMNNPKYGLDKIFPGLAQYRTAPTVTANPYEVAGAPPAMQAATGGTLANLGAGALDAAGALGTIYAAKEGVRT